MGGDWIRVPVQAVIDDVGHSHLVFEPSSLLLAHVRQIKEDRRKDCAGKQPVHFVQRKWKKDGLLSLKMFGYDFLR